MLSPNGARCGCFIVTSDPSTSSQFLPLVSVNTHATLYASTSRTLLTQTFINPRKDQQLDQVNYIFPLVDGVAVVGFTCRIGEKVIKGLVKERQQAKQEFVEAKERGELAGLLERSTQSTDIFSTSLGNVPAGAKVVVEITYLGELKHDAEVDGLRLTIPSVIAPRYGQTEMLKEADGFVSSGMSITVDAEMPSAIKSVQSPSHAVSVNIGTTSANHGAAPTFNKASASLSLVTAQLDSDFVLQVITANLGEPSAVLETHPTIPNQKALMATLVPKFNLPSLKPEVVFICDRSGSMNGKITNLVNALQIFLRSLPVGAKFNICSFGTRHTFLWEKSRTYDQESLDQASAHVKTFDANYGGTTMYGPLEETFARRYKDTELEVFLLTDGQVSSQEQMFELTRKAVEESKGAIRVFTLGVGRSASSSLIEGVARAGNGVSQTVGDSEKMDKKVIRMLKAALTPHVNDYSLEIKYEPTEDEEEFELIEKVNDALIIDAQVVESEDETKKATPPISLFDPTVGDDTAMPDAPSSSNKFDHLPAVPVPAYLQAPFKIPSLFTFNRTTIYVLMSGAESHRVPKSVILRGTSAHGPLELEIPVANLSENGQTIHQLAARKAVQDLEQGGGGWLAHAKNKEGKLLKEAHESRFEDMVQREAVRLGVQYQVGGKWCSFVAVEEGDGDKEGETSELAKIETVEHRERGGRGLGVGGAMRHRKIAMDAAAPPPLPASIVESLHAQRSSGFGETHALMASEDVQMRQPSSVGWFAPTSGGFGSALNSFGSRSAPPPPPAPAPASTSNMGVQNVFERFAARHVPSSAQSTQKKKKMASPETVASVSNGLVDEEAQVDKDVSHMSSLSRLVHLQSFVGSWAWSDKLEGVLGITKDRAAELLQQVGDGSEQAIEVSATLCAVFFLRTKVSGEKESWEMIVEKAGDYVKEQTGKSIDEFEAIFGSVLSAEFATAVSGETE